MAFASLPLVASIGAGALGTFGAASGLSNLFGGGGGSSGKQEAIDAMSAAIDARIDKFKESVAITRPFRQAGKKGLERIQADAAERGPLQQFQERTGRANIAQDLQQFGFNPQDVGAATGRFEEGLTARDLDARTGRAIDLANLGTRFASQGAGAAGVAGRGIAGAQLGGGRGIVEALQQANLARQSGLATAFQGAQRIGGSLLTNNLLQQQAQLPNQGGFGSATTGGFVGSPRLDTFTGGPGGGSFFTPGSPGFVGSTF